MPSSYAPILQIKNKRQLRISTTLHQQNFTSCHPPLDYNFNTSIPVKYIEILFNVFITIILSYFSLKHYIDSLHRNKFLSSSTTRFHSILAYLFSSTTETGNSTQVYIRKIPKHLLESNFYLLNSKPHLMTNHILSTKPTAYHTSPMVS